MGELNVSREDALATLWERGEVWYKLYPDQLEVYRFIADCNERIIVINLCRQFGKSFTLALKAIEFAIKRPEALIRYVTGTQKALRKIVQPIFRDILKDCPEHLRPAFNSLESVYRFPNGAEIHMAGANDGHADDSRGQRAHLCLVEEAGFIDDLDYLVTSVLLPQTKTTGGKIILISTPPITPAHAFHGFATRAEAAGGYIVRTIDDDTHTSEREKATLIREMGGRASSRARRELWCEFIVDEERAVIPEATDEWANAAVAEATGPTYEQPLVAMDLGWEDRTGILAGYYDFKRARLVIQAEALLRRARTDEIVKAARELEARLWTGKRPPMRVCDAPLLVLNDIQTFHQFPVAAPMKDELEAMVNEVRLWVTAGRIQIDPSCRQLVAQLKTATWDSRRKAFERTAEGHSDLVAALIYMIRTAPVATNPYPALAEGVTDYTHQILEHARKRETGAEKALKELFGMRRRHAQH